MKVDYDLYYKDSGSVNKGHYVESNESVSISLSHDYTTVVIQLSIHHRNTFVVNYRRARKVLLSAPRGGSLFLFYWVNKCTCYFHEVWFCINYQKFTYGSRETELLAKAAQDKCIESRGCAYKLFAMQRKRNHWDVSPCNGNFIKPGCDRVHFRTQQQRGHPTSIFGKYLFGGQFEI